MKTLLVQTPFEAACTRDPWNIRSLCNDGKNNYLRLIGEMKHPTRQSQRAYIANNIVHFSFYFYLFKLKCSHFLYILLLFMGH